MCIAVAPPPKKPREKGEFIKKFNALLKWPLRLMGKPVQPEQTGRKPSGESLR